MADLPQGNDGGQKSKHWNVFPADYARVFDEPALWPSLLRNALTVGFNDDFLVFCEGGEMPPGESGREALWEKRWNHDYAELLPERLTDPKQVERIRNLFVKVVAQCGPEFIMDNLATSAGSPASIDAKVQRQDRAAEEVISLNYHDLLLLPYAWQIIRCGKAILGDSPVILEIGGGYGGMAAKLIEAWPDATIYLLDLPEVLAVQAYYLHARFPEARLSLLDDARDSPDADFVLLPGWRTDLLADQSVDLAINVRSMMEMSRPVIETYFAEIQRMVRDDGLFACMNRYYKGNEDTRFKVYPFDHKWQLLLSQVSVIQPHIHELIVQRTAAPQHFTVSAALESLP